MILLRVKKRFYLTIFLQLKKGVSKEVASNKVVQPTSTSSSQDIAKQIQAQKEKRQLIAQKTSGVRILDQKKKRPVNEKTKQQTKQQNQENSQQHKPKVKEHSLEKNKSPKPQKDKLFDKTITDQIARKQRLKLRVDKKANKPDVQIESKHTFNKPVKPIVKEIAIHSQMSVADLAKQLAIKSTEVVSTLFKLGMTVTINDVLDEETAVIVIEEMGT